MGFTLLSRSLQEDRLEDCLRLQMLIWPSPNSTLLSDAS